ncbi:MAG: TonB-dependent hemoglobin/transferrin/lactoferrin family receptor [Gammaproteobacteria bacterium]|nr:TonB-dependent hemoglobin/transferrin/lactoferrin family receptor [Gammaproteobacteria bacterium]MBU1554525.1 TonB-dependent hemoglobin/transferrin/lactoferrin family receptor [Gammaproteobacteria bacterium]MBU2071029.1 TonB-dependent hemoglobin/transferrin/lactoferrin family receptor [Gammaproteobacteria bacterium]MBU2184297.1 TonB-dependent hemoglobin/transferrin/lactoferrin family receptor [Gammaproteobacteria bacterium]MBU2206446.1 TonB-dependent hemoglobin/transferrin/lactoferrin family
MQYTLLALAISHAMALPLLADTATPELDTVSVTAQAPLSQANSKQSQQLSATDLQQQQVQNIADVVRFVPGVTTTDMGRFGSNGFNIRGLDGDRVAITVDGLSLGETLDPPSFVAYEFFRSARGGVDMDALKQVEIIKGADAIAAGSGALAGAVLFVTKDPADYLAAQGNDSHLALKAGFSGLNNETLFSTTVANRSDKLESLLVFTRRDGSETKTARSGANISGAGRTVADPLDYGSNNVLAKLQYQLTDSQRLGWVGEYFSQNSELDNQSRLDSVYLSRRGDDEIERKRLGLQYDWLAARSFADSVNATVDYQTNYTNGVTTMLTTGCSGATNGGVSPCLRSEDRDFKQQQLKLAVALEKELLGDSVQQQWLYGIAAERRNVEFSAIDRRYIGETGELASPPVVDPDQVPETDVTALSLYARDVIKLTPRWTLSLGGRFDGLKYQPKFDAQFNDNTQTVAAVDFSAFTWQSNLTYQLDSTQQLWLQAGRGFRAPTVAEMYAPTSLVSRTEKASGLVVEGLLGSIANPDLNAERSLNLEAGYRYQSDSLLLGLSVFNDQYSDMIDSLVLLQNPDTVYESCFRGVCTESLGNPYTTMANTGEADVKGIELEAGWRISAAVSSRLALSYNDGETQDGEPLRSVNPASAVLGLRYDGANWDLMANISHSAAKKAKDAYNADGTAAATYPYLTDSYTVVDLMANYDISPQWRLSAGIYNLFDEEYYQWQRVRFVTNWVGSGVRGGVLPGGEGLQRYSEPGRYAKLAISYVF